MLNLIYLLSEKQMKKSIVISGLLIAFSAVFTLSMQAGEKEDYSKIKQQLTKVLNSEIKSVSPSPISGLYQVITDKGIVFTSLDGNYMLMGELYDISKKPVNLTDMAMSGLRLEQLNSQEKSMIVYPAKEEKYVVTVFTDVDCGYCRKLHNQMTGYNKLGITIRYMAFPRGGPASPAYSQMEAIWCSDDPAKAMTDAKNGRKFESKSCKSPVQDHYALGNSFGVRGTPALVLQNGNMLPGYLPPAKLLAALQKK